MSDNQDRYTIGDLIEEGIIIAHKDGNYGSLYPRVAEFGNEGVPFLTAKLISDDGQINWENAPRLNTETAESFNYGFIKENDVLLSHNATIGRVALVPQLEERVLVGTSLTYYRLDSSRLLPRYLATFFRGRDFQNQLASVMSHTTRNQVPITAQRKLTVVVPQLHEQRAIASILGALDDKIELNRRMNATLESLARALFKSWFVDFDPVKINAGQMPPSSASSATHDPSVLELFPSTFQDSELGPIPDGWSVLPLEDVMDSIIDYRGKTPEKTEAGIPLVTAKIVKSGRILPITEFIATEDFDKWMCRGLPKPGDIIMTTEAPLGEVAQLDRRKVALAQRVITLRGKADCLHNSYLRFLMQSEYFQHDLFARSSGTTVVGIKQSELRKISLLVPPIELQNAFGELVVPMTDLIDENWRQVSILSELRDQLLPRLLSGSLAVSDFHSPEGKRAWNT